MEQFPQDPFDSDQESIESRSEDFLEDDQEETADVSDSAREKVELLAYPPVRLAGGADDCPCDEDEEDENGEDDEAAALKIYHYLKGYFTAMNNSKEKSSKADESMDHEDAEISPLDQAINSFNEREEQEEEEALEDLGQLQRARRQLLTEVSNLQTAADLVKSIL